jgi:hypothetical protein
MATHTSAPEAQDGRGRKAPQGGPERVHHGADAPVASVLDAGAASGRCEVSTAASLAAQPVDRGSALQVGGPLSRKVFGE